MSTTVTYKGQTLTTVENQTKTLNTAGTWVEGDFTLTDVTQGGGGDEMYKLAAGTITDADVDWSKVTKIRISGFQNCTLLTSVDNPILDTTYHSMFEGCTGLQTFECSITANNPRYGNTVLKGCTNLKTATFHFLNLSSRTVWGGTYFFENDSSLETVIFDSKKNDLGITFYLAFTKCTALRTLVMKCTTMVVWSGGSWDKNTFAGIYDNPTESTIYVPQALISSYQTATNWSTLYNAGVTFAPIEGSIYE
jgi:hypothetical protein